MDGGRGAVKLIEAARTAGVRRYAMVSSMGAVLAAVLDEPGTIGVTFEVVGGDTPIPEAVAALRAGP